MTDTDDICGEIADGGEICGLSAGWGRDEDSGPCKHHADVTQLPRKWSHERIEGIIQDTERTGSFKFACEANEIDYSTGKRWLNRADDLEDCDQSEAAERLRAFRARVTRARGTAKSGIAGDILEMARNPENPRPDVLLRYLKEVLGGEANMDGDDADLAGDWFDADSDVVRYSPDQEVEQ